MNKYKYISIKSIIEDVFRNTYNDGSIDKTDLLVFADDAIDRIIPGSEFAHRIVLLDVKNYTCTLPRDFKYVCQAAYNAEYEDYCVDKEQVVQWTQQSLTNECNLEINLKCPPCTELCDDDVIEVDADFIWESAHPELQASYMRHFHTYRNFNERGKSCYYHPHFRLMRMTSNNFFNVPYHIDNCLNINYDTTVEYSIDHNHKMVTNFKEGQVLVSYLGYVMDDEGYRMIPDISIVFRAVNHYIEERLAFKQYKMTRKQEDRIFWQQMFELAEKFIARARAELDMPTPDRMKQFIDNHWRKVIRYTDFEANLGKFKPDEFAYPDQTYNFGRTHYYGRR